MTKTRYRPARTALAAAATAALCSGALAVTATPAHATGDHGDDGYDVVIPLSQRASNELRDGANKIAALGKAEKWAHDGRVALSFPVAGDGHHRTGDGHDSMRLRGGIAYTGAGRNVTWTKIRIADRGVITAVLSGGKRFAVLKIAGDRHHRTADRNGGDLTLVLTKSGAGSLNNAASGAPFRAGDVFAGGNDCR